MTSALIAAPALEQTWHYFDLEAHNARQRKLRDVLTGLLQAALAREAALRQENAALVNRQREREVAFEQRIAAIERLIATLSDNDRTALEVALHIKRNDAVPSPVRWRSS